MFDLASLDILKPSEEGRVLTLRHPKTGQPFLDDKRQPLTITLLGRWAGVVMQKADDLEARRAARPAGFEMTKAESVASDAEYFAAATPGWSFTHLGGEEFPFTQQNAAKLYADPRFPWLRVQVAAFHQQDGNFLAMPTSPA